MPRKTKGNMMPIVRVIRAVIFGALAFFIYETEFGIGEGTSIPGILCILVATLIGFSLPSARKKKPAGEGGASAAEDGGASK